MKIMKAQDDDLQTILELQYLAYQSEAKLLNNDEIPPLKQTISEIRQEYARGVIVKAIDSNGEIIGSVRAYRNGHSVHIGKLMVHPDQQKKGIGAALLREIEMVCPSARYELFTSDKSQSNLRLYEKSGYVRCQEQEISPTLRLIFLDKKRPV